MNITHVDVELAREQEGSPVKAYVTITIEKAFVVRNIRIIKSGESLILAMPSRKIRDECWHCTKKNDLNANFCNKCGAPQPANRAAAHPRLHEDVAHPITSGCREVMEQKIFPAYQQALFAPSRAVPVSVTNAQMATMPPAA